MLYCKVRYFRSGIPALPLGRLRPTLLQSPTGNFPALMNDEVAGIISSLDGFPTDEASKEALSVSNLYLEVPYAEKVSEVNDVLDTYHKSIMNREVSIDDGIASMNEEVGKILGN